MSDDYLDHDEKRVPVDRDRLDIRRGVHEDATYFLEYTLRHESGNYRARIENRREIRALLRQHDGYDGRTRIRSKRDVTNERVHAALEHAMYLELQDKNPEQYWVDNCRVVREINVRDVNAPSDQKRTDGAFQPHVEDEPYDLGTVNIWVHPNDDDDFISAIERRVEYYGATAYQIEDVDPAEDEDYTFRWTVRLYNDRAKMPEGATAEVEAE